MAHMREALDAMIHEHHTTHGAGIRMRNVYMHTTHGAGIRMRNV